MIILKQTHTHTHTQNHNHNQNMKRKQKLFNQHKIPKVQPVE